jgi:hypothetical protein
LRQYQQVLHHIPDDILALFVEDGPVLDDLTEVKGRVGPGCRKAGGMRIVCETNKVIYGIETLKLRQGVGVRRALIIFLNETDVRTLEPRIVSSLPLLVFYQNRCSHQILYHSFLQKSTLLCKQRANSLLSCRKDRLSTLLAPTSHLDYLLHCGNDGEILTSANT